MQSDATKATGGLSIDRLASTYSSRRKSHVNKSVMSRKALFSNMLHARTNACSILLDSNPFNVSSGGQNNESSKNSSVMIKYHVKKTKSTLLEKEARAVLLKLV